MVRGNGSFSFEATDAVDAQHLRSCLSKRGYRFLYYTEEPPTNFGDRK